METKELSKVSIETIFDNTFKTNKYVEGKLNNQFIVQDPFLIDGFINSIFEENTYNFDNIEFSEREIDILMKAFGYYSERYSIERIADIYNVSIEDVAEIIKIGKRKILILLKEDNLISKGYIKCKAKNR